MAARMMDSGTGKRGKGESAPRLIVAREEPGWRARVVRRRPLRYAGGADAATDRPGHVRAASALVRLGRRFVVVQDDALFLALVEPREGDAIPVALPAGAGGARQFDDRRGNKAQKLDLEAGVVLPRRDGERLVLFGSGSTPERERIVVLCGEAEAPSVRVTDARALYESLRKLRAFSGSELNLEGACVAGDGRRVRLLNRGNGAPRDGRQPIDATCELDAADLLAWLEGAASSPPPPGDVVGYDLGAVDGVRLTFTDAEALPDGMLFVAAAEASPDAVRDGPVAGAVLGLSDGRGARWARILDEGGLALREKIEGVTIDPEDGWRVFAVVDADDAERPASLLDLEWGGEP